MFLQEMKQFHSFILQLFETGFYKDVITLGEIYFASVDKLDIDDHYQYNQVLFYVASSYKATCNPEYAILLLERNQNPEPINNFLLSKFYYQTHKYDKFITFSQPPPYSIHQINNEKMLFLKEKFSIYAGFIAKLLSDYYITKLDFRSSREYNEIALICCPLFTSELVKAIEKDWINFDTNTYFRRFFQVSRKRATESSNNNIDEKSAEIPHHDSSKELMDKINNAIDMHSGITKTVLKTEPDRCFSNEIMKNKFYSIASSTPLLLNPLFKNNNNLKYDSSFKIPHKFKTNESYLTRLTQKNRESIKDDEKITHCNNDMNEDTLPDNDKLNFDYKNLPLPKQSVIKPIPFQMEEIFPKILNSSNLMLFRKETNNTTYFGENYIEKNTIGKDVQGNTSDSTELVSVVSEAKNDIPESAALSKKCCPVSNKAFSKDSINFKRIITGIYCFIRLHSRSYFKNMKVLQEFFEEMPQKLRVIPRITSLIGSIMFRFHSYEDAVSIFSRLHVDHPHFYDCFDLFSSSLWHMKNGKMLEKLSTEMRENAPLLPQTWIVHGNFCNLMKRNDIATESFRRSIQLDPKSTYAYILLGKEHFDKCQHDLALNMYRKALIYDPNSYHAWYAIAETHLEKQNYSLAIRSIERALAINQNDGILWSLASAIHLAVGDFNYASVYIDKAINICQNIDGIKLQKAKILISCKKFHEARDFLCAWKSTIINNKLRSEVYLLLGKVYLTLQDYEKTESYLSSCVELDLGGKLCSEARKIMGKLGLLHGGVISKTNALLDARNNQKIETEFKASEKMIKFLRSLD